MNDNDEHIGVMEAQLKQWGAQLDELGAQAALAGDEVKTEYHVGIAYLKATHVRAQAKLAEFREASADTWDTVSAALEGTYEEMKSAFARLGRD